MKATLTITGLYNWDDTIFDGWQLPIGVDLDHLKSAVLYECSGLELTLPNPDIFKVCTASWCLRKNRAWTRALDAMKASYNPIHNYDRTETHSENESGSSGHNGELSSTSTETTAAFNSSNYSPKSKVENGQESESSATYGRTAAHTITAKGNIGVTTSQQMVRDEIELSPDLDIYRIITQDFKKEFCVMVY